MAHRPIPGIHDSTRLIRTAMVHLPRRPTAWGLGRTHLQGHCKVWLHADANPSLPLTGQRNLAFHGTSKRSPAPTGLLHKLGCLLGLIGVLAVRPRGALAATKCSICCVLVSCGGFSAGVLAAHCLLGWHCRIACYLGNAGACLHAAGRQPPLRGGRSRHMRSGACSWGARS